MATSPKRVYWDSCSWIALIQNEKIIESGVIVENRGALCRAVISQATEGDVEIFASAFTLVEVNKGKDFFENDYIVVVSLDRRVGELGRDLVQRGYSKLKPPDASHFAAAAVACVEEMHTFDDRLLALDGKIEGGRHEAADMQAGAGGSAAPTFGAYAR